jgi:hypothetical protein
MKSRSWVDDIRQRAYEERTRVIVPGQRTSRNWPLCLTCGRDVDAAGIRDLNRLSVEIWAKCKHLSKDASDVEYEMAKSFEDYYKVNFPFRLEEDPVKDERVQGIIQRAMGDATFFDPTRPPK